MALVQINGHLYYTQSVRVGRRVTSACLAKGKLALFMAVLREEDRRESLARRLERIEQQRQQIEKASGARRLAREAWKEWTRRLDSTERFMLDYYRDVGRAAEASLLRFGFYRHARGEWRKRRLSMLREAERYGALAPLTANEQLAERAWKGDPAALESALLEAQRHHLETVESVLLDQLSIGSGPPYHDPRDFVEVRLANMRHELAPPGSSAAERLLAERASLCWLHQELLEYESTRLFARSEVDSRKAEVLDRRLARVQARFAHALTALAKVRRLSIPVVVNQLNVGARVNGTVQVSGS
jgi:hypothetical protein